MSYGENMNKITTNEEILEALSPVPNFTTRDDIKPWIHEILDGRGINLVIERSDASKVVFKCKNLHRKSSTPRSTTTKIINGKQVLKRVRRSIPEDSCPFRLRVSYSVKYKNWSVNIIKHEHNFSLCSNFGLSQSSPIDHASVAAARQYGNQGINTSRPGLSTKRSYYTSTTPSPNSSSYTNSPAVSTSSNTPHEFLDYEPSFKRQKQFEQSPLYNEIDPLDHASSLQTEPLQLHHHHNNHSHHNQHTQESSTSTLHEDLNYVYAGGSASDSLDQTNEFSSTLADYPFSNDAMIRNSLSNTETSTLSASAPSTGANTTTTNSSTGTISTGPSSTTSNSIFDNTASNSSIQAQLFNDDFSKFYNSSASQQATAISSSSSATQKNSSLNIKQEEIQDNDPLMYLLSSANSNYSFEELENLDKAMGIDANDKILMSMFQGM